MLAIHAEEGEGSGQPSKPQPTPSPTQSFHEEQLYDIPSSSQPQKTQKHKKGRKLSNKVLDLEKAMAAQAKEIAIFTEEVKNLENAESSSTTGFINHSSSLVLPKEDVWNKADAIKLGRFDRKEMQSKWFIAAAEVVNAGISVCTADHTTPPQPQTLLAMMRLQLQLP
ncbi:hypothetical protein Tco_1492572 [Tanacetum coccineum]